MRIASTNGHKIQNWELGPKLRIRFKNGKNVRIDQKVIIFSLTAHPRALFIQSNQEVYSFFPQQLTWWLVIRIYIVRCQISRIVFFPNQWCSSLQFTPSDWCLMETSSNCGFWWASLSNESQPFFWMTDGHGLVFNRL